MLSRSRSLDLALRRTVGVVGMTGAGKTTLLVSLIDHLRNHDPGRFRFGPPGTAVRAFNELPVASVARLDYDRARQALVDGEWPDKTLAMQAYRAKLWLERNGKPAGCTELTFLDLPGERLADAGIAAHDFAGWSDRWLDELGRVPDFRKSAQPFLAAVAAAKANPQGWDPAALAAAYRETLAGFLADCVPYVAPSSFWMSADGRFVPDVITAAERDDPATLRRRLAELGVCGLDESRQFVPLPPELRAAPAGARMRTAYEAYRAAVVRPLFRALSRCDDLLVVVDLCTILQSGHGWMNVTSNLLARLFDAVRPGFSAAGRVADRLTQAATLGQVKAAGVRRVIFVATQADCVHPDDHDALLGLLGQLTRPARQGMSGDRQVRASHHACAAVASATAAPQDGRADTPDRTLSYNVRIDGGGTAPRQLAMPPFPTKFPNGWQADQFVFPHPAPWMPAATTNPPDQIGVDRLAGVILDL